MSKELFIEARNLVFAYQSGINIINDLNLSLYRGEIVFLTGVNGAGKTTLGKLLAGIMKPDAGGCFLLREELSTIPLYLLGQRIAYCFQNPGKQLFAATVEEEIAFGLKYRGASPEHIAASCEAMLKLFELEHLCQHFPHNLSWGEKKRTALAACLALEPDYLILDEPSIGLDEKRLQSLAETLQHLRKEGVGALIISHNQDFIRENAQRILLMEEGRITDDCRC